MIIQPKFRGFICTTAHPIGCKQHVQEQIQYVKNKGSFKGPKNVLVIGSSTGYGLASRIASAFGAGAATIGVCFERPASGKRTATAGWYNTAAFEEAAHQEGLYAKTINGDAFSTEIKEKTIDLIRKDLGKVDLVVYSLASPKRVHPITGETFTSVIKPVNDSFTSKTVDFHTGDVSYVTIDPATDEEIRHTIAVMGGEDWQMWMDALREADLLAPGATTIAYSYIGPELTHPVYKDGTIGKAKEDLEKTAKNLRDQLQIIGGRAYISVNKALVTQSSSAIPVVPLYMSLLFKVMKEKNLHEGCIEQMQRLFAERLYAKETPTDSEGRIRMDDWEMKEEVQETVLRLWKEVNTDNVYQLSDLVGFRTDFFRLFGFEFEGIDYEKETDPNVSIPSLEG